MSSNRIRNWYNGESTPYYSNGQEPIGGIGVLPDYHIVKFHWTAKVVRGLVAFYKRHWQWLIPTLLSALAAAAAVAVLFQSNACK